MTKRILVTGTSARDELLQPLRDAGYSIEIAPGLLSEAELRAQLSGAVAYLLGGDEVATEAVLSQASHLKVIAFLGMGYESFIDMAATKKFGIPVTNTPGTLTQSVAEFTVGQTLNVLRRLSAYGRLPRLSDVRDDYEEKTHELKSRRIGIIGLGAVGTRIAEILTLGFSCKLSYWSRTRKPSDEARLGLLYKSMHELLETTDILILMTPGNASTHNLIGREEIARLPRGATIVNTARPDIVEPAALLDALRSGHIESVAFDPLYDEKVSQRTALLAFPEERVVATRHIASLTHEARDGMTIKAVQSILNLLNGKSDRYVVNA